MSKRIDAEWLLNFVAEFPDHYTLTVGNLRAVVNDAPSIDIEPKRGEWIDKGNWMGIECSRCKCHSRYVTPFCPQCGARMKGANDEVLRQL